LFRSLLLFDGNDPIVVLDSGKVRVHAAPRINLRVANGAPDFMFHWLLLKLARLITGRRVKDAIRFCFIGSFLFN
jgi:hypothetical protein